MFVRNRLSSREEDTRIENRKEGLFFVSLSARHFPMRQAILACFLFAQLPMRGREPARSLI